MSSSQPFVLSPDEAEVFTVGPFRIVSRVLPDQSQGAWELYELTMGPATIDYHVHRTMDETLYLVEGEIKFVVAGETFHRPAGSVAFIPRGVHHGFTNPGPDRSRVLILFSPSGSQDEYFRKLQKLFAAPSLAVGALQALRRQYDQELVNLDG